MLRKLFLLLLVMLGLKGVAQKAVTTDVVVIGGGTGGTAAGVQSARLGAKTVIVESTPWLGGMISAAGVSAIDGNHRLPSGLWAEFRNRLYKVYGGPAAVETGWVSNTQFEPHVADSIFKSMAAAEKNLTVHFNHVFTGVTKSGNRIQAASFRDRKTGETLTIQANIFIDATELGDVTKAAGVAYSLGMEAGGITGEKVGITQTNNIVQDLTYVAVLKDFGAGSDRTIAKPAGYDPAEFDAACTDYYHDKKRKAPGVDGRKMLDYGKLPNGKYMINWPIYGNDTYLNVVELSEEEREKELVKAKETTLRFVYFIQNQLGFKNLGLANDEFPTADGLALMPYHREGRRVNGLVRFTMQHIAAPFTYGDPLYRTGISVGDYPIDHHHKKNAQAPQHLEFYPIPSFNVPLGALIPRKFDNLVVAEKGISVSNVVNGTTRLQPCVLLTGQAAGTLAALAARNNQKPADVGVRRVQQQLLDAGAYIMPYIDVTPAHPHFKTIQKIGAVGLLKGTGIPYKWANQTWFYPDSLVKTADFASSWKEYSGQQLRFTEQYLKLGQALQIIHNYQRSLQKNKEKKIAYGTFVRQTEAAWADRKLPSFNPEKELTRTELSVLLEDTLQPFETRQVNHHGYFRKTN